MCMRVVGQQGRQPNPDVTTAHACPTSHLLGLGPLGALWPAVSPGARNQVRSPLCCYSLAGAPPSSRTSAPKHIKSLPASSPMNPTVEPQLLASLAAVLLQRGVRGEREAAVCAPAPTPLPNP